MSERRTAVSPSRVAWAALDEHLAAVAAMDRGRIEAGYREDALLRTPDGEVRGRRAIGQWFSHRGEFFRSLRLRVERIEAWEGFAAMEWWADRGEGPPPLEGRDEFFIDEEGLIVEQRVARVGKASRPPLFVRLEIAPPLAHLVLDRDEKRNAVTQGMLSIMRARVSEVEGDARLKAMVLRGDGRDFCAGEDVAGFDFPDHAAAERFLEGPLGLFEAMETLPKPVVAAVQGHALGFGSEVLLVADAVFASPNAIFGFAEIDHGAVPSVLVTRGLDVLFRRRVLGLGLTGKRMSAEEALEARLVHEVVEDPLARAEEAALQMASWSQEAVALVKGLLGSTAGEDHGRAREFMPGVLTQVRVAR